MASSRPQTAPAAGPNVDKHHHSLVAGNFAMFVW